MLDLVKKASRVRKSGKRVFDPLKKDILKLINSGHLAPGAMVPPEHSLALKYDICRASVRLALKELTEEGVLFKRPGKGTYVRDTSAVEEKSPQILNIGLDIEIPMSGLDWYGSKILDGIEDVCNKSNCRLVFFRQPQLKTMRKELIDGLITTYTTEDQYPLYEQLGQHDVHPVLINRITEHEHIAYFAVNYRREAERAIKLMLAKGHRRFGIITTSLKEGNPVTNARYLGFKDATAPYGATVTHCLCETLFKQSEESYSETIYSFLEKNQVDAVYLLNGSFAIPLFTAIQRLKLKVPNELEIMCFDDVAYAYRLYHMPFYYVKMPLHEMGRAAATYLVDKIIHGKLCPVIKRIYDAEIVEISYKK